MKPYWQNSAGTIFHGDVLDVLRGLPDESVHCCVTSPPYWGLRDYGVDGQIGLEETPEEFTANMVKVFHEVRRVLRGDGTLWLNLGDTYAAGGLGHGSGKQTTNYGSCNGGHIEKARKAPDGLKQKDLCGIPWRVAFALQADGWYLRQDIIWHKPNPMPESVRDRCTKSHEYLFLMSKGQRYHYDDKAIQERALRPEGAGNKYAHKVENERPGGNANLGGGLHKVGPRDVRNKRSVWSVVAKPFRGAHFATFPPALIQPCIMAGCPEGGVVLDPFFGSGTAGIVAHQLDRKFIGIELNKSYLDDIAVPRIEAETAQLKLFA